MLDDNNEPQSFKSPDLVTTLVLGTEPGTEFNIFNRHSDLHLTEGEISVRANNRIIPIGRTDFFRMDHLSAYAMPPIIRAKQIGFILDLGVCGVLARSIEFEMHGMSRVFVHAYSDDVEFIRWLAS